MCVREEGPLGDRRLNGVQPDTYTALRQPWELYVLVGLIITSSLLVLTDISPEGIPWLMVLMAVGIGQALLLPAPLSLVAGGAVLVVWAFVTWQPDLWQIERQMVALAQIAVVALSIGMAARFRRIWQRQQDELSRYHDLRRRILEEGVGAGLCTRGMAELRMAAELEKARAEGQPMGAMLIEISGTLSGVEAGLAEEAFREAARALGYIVEAGDVPFRDGAQRLGVILSGRPWDNLCQMVETVQRAVREAPVLDADGVPRRVGDCSAVYFGLGVYRGGAGEVDLLRAAEDSLHISREMGGFMGLANGHGSSYPH
jgi:GGDEF domain-containing protein